MKPNSILLSVLVVACMSSCGPRTPLPWRLMELGTAPITAAWERGEAVAAFTEGQQWPGLIFATDSSQIGRIVRREAQALPPISCGDKMRLHPKDLPLSWARVLGWRKPRQPHRPLAMPRPNRPRWFRPAPYTSLGPTCRRRAPLDGRTEEDGSRLQRTCTTPLPTGREGAPFHRMSAA